jgi:outer membrane protein assembly factor BamE
MVFLPEKIFTVSYSAVLTLKTYRPNKMVARLLVSLAFLTLAGCSIMPSILYRIDVQQGNVVTEEMLEKLKPGMTKSQVLFVLGSPLIVDAFRDNRWDYVYLLREKGDLVEQKRMTLFFDHDNLIKIENYLIDSKKTAKPAPLVEKPDEKTAAPEAKEAVLQEKKITSDKKMKPIDDEDENCNIPSSVSIKP